ncbi:Anaphase-promoting complex subunit 5 [Apostasia shenzhenica]|uniref:Anaphase-promoting complex subunit 5 n=1 Tax=Apostasia shenzhenica TaxID=1088818 RepID=A0A2I0AN77_9ASPA|nr:Anaphase-promoting complex subunit 5 [Apostasia shenzhenica]
MSLLLLSNWVGIGRRSADPTHLPATARLEPGGIPAPSYFTVNFAHLVIERLTKPSFLSPPGDAPRNASPLYAEMSRLAVSGSSKEGSFAVFDLTPHKIAVCHLIQLFAPLAQQVVPFPFESVSHHNRLGLFLFSLTKACNDFVEPTLEELLNQLRALGGSVNVWFCDHLMSNLLEISSPDDLFNFFDKLRGVITSDSTDIEDDQIILDPSSHIGIFLRCCILSFNLLNFEGVCHLLTSIATYCNSTGSVYELPEEDVDESELDHLLVDTDLGNKMDAPQKYRCSIEASTSDGGSSTSHIHMSSSISSPINDVHVSADSDFKGVGGGVQGVEFMSSLKEYSNVDDYQGFLQPKWQVEGYLTMQADLLEKDTTSYPLNSFTATLNQIQKLAPELHRVKYLKYLNGVYHEDYLIAMENLHRYFDYSAGTEGIFNRSSTPPQEIYVGRYETALLCLGNMHACFGHPKKALEALTEAVRFSQLSNDDPCLAYTLSAICKLFSEVGISSTAGSLGSQDSLETNMSLGAPLSTQQQLLVLLQRSLERADSLKLMSLMAFNRLALSKFYLKHVERPLLSFGPKDSIKLRTCPVTICKELRLSSYVLGEFGSDGLLQTNDDGAFSTSWIKNLSSSSISWFENTKHVRSSVANDFDLFHFDAQPNPVPRSALQLAGSSYLMRATSWELYGSAPSVRLNALVYATCFADAASSVELSLAYVKLIQHLAIFKGYEEAFTALRHAEKKFLPKSKSRIQLLKLQLLHERALHIGQLQAAQQMCDEIGVLASSASGVDLELKIEENLRFARTLLAANEFSKAAGVAYSLFCMCYKFNLQVENATVLLLLSEIHKKSGNAVLALPYVLASLSFCQAFNLDLLEASANLTLAELWLSLGSNHARRALILLHRTLPMILGHGGLELRARANITLAKCHLSDPTFSISEDPNILLDPLNQAAEEFEILEYHEMAAEAFYLMAMVYNHLGQLEAREEAAESFRKHVTALENPHSEDPFLR